MLEYTVFAVLSVVVVVALELLWFRTGVFRTLQYWIAMAIVLGFQVPVDGWLTKLSDPIVLYEESEMTGWRIPWDIPVEDFAFGFSMVTLTMLLWLRLGPRPVAETPPSTSTPSEQRTP
ncbi:lycopene cyclase [Marmoricola sp. Leaf446]|uniref:lycopene cyclase domain-containing protein n=1 Tax=Marmoricola sp. Leaf446 TaxID=1736379 RepID=UPI0006F5EA59|nr:lycopene cyclase domain-containing protein [Marmoricola sp. Leaf446]KQT91460.1 lycopene cyclase [Marmoricola sp. Leaf446]